MPRLLIKALLSSALVFAVFTGAWAQPPEFPPLKVERARGVIHLENHGHFRVRSSYFTEPGMSADDSSLLYRGSSSDLAPGEIDSSFFSSDLRFRYEPRLHISNNFTLNMTADLLKDLRMGEARQTSAGDQPTATEQDSFANHDGREQNILVTRLYGNWEPVSGLKLRVGRMPAHFGLGIEENSGDCDDCNGGTVVDGFDAKVNALGSGIRIAWWWPGEGVSNLDADSRSGQPYDLSDLDDVSEWLFEFTPESSGEFAEQKKIDDARLNSGWLFDWAARFKWRTAGLQSDRFPKGVPCEGAAPDSDTPYDCMSLIPRDLSLWTPGLFLQLRGWPAPDKYLELNLEVQAKLGSIGNVFDTTPEPNSEEEISSSREIQALGAAFQGAYTQNAWTIGVKSGLATGDSEGSFLGVRDGSNTIAPESASQSEQEKYQQNQTFEQFIFHQDFFTDSLLFREVVGAVTNTIFVRPSLAYRLDQGTQSFTFEGGLLSAWAMASEATPGQSSDYGIEADLKVIYAASQNLKLAWTCAGLKPGKALAPGIDAEAPPGLYSTQIDLFIRF